MLVRVAICMGVCVGCPQSEVMKIMSKCSLASVLLVWVGGLLATWSPALAQTAKRPDAKPQKVRPPWRELRDYPRPPAPDTGWGIHDNPNCVWQASPEVLKEMRERYGFSWFKVLACGENKVEVVRAARAAGIEPVVRLYVDRPSPYYPRSGDEEKTFRQQVRAYVRAGGHYIEAGNEPNLSLEWTPGEWDKPDRIERLCRQWLRVRAMIAEEGGIPVFYAMSVGGEDKRSAGAWWKDCFETFKKWGKIEEAFAGAAFGVHLGTANHPLDYPFDPARNLPHATPEERIASLMQDNTCYLGVELLIHLMHDYLPAPLPILSTEGGAFPNNRDDPDYPKVALELHRDLNLGIFQRMNPKHPEYWGDPLFAQMSWIWHADEGIFAIDSWHDNPEFGRMPILDALEREPRFDRGVIFARPHRMRTGH